MSVSLYGIDKKLFDKKLFDKKLFDEKFLDKNCCKKIFENASSIAGMLLTTECTIVDKPKEEPAMPSMPGGGMGGMM